MTEIKEKRKVGRPFKYLIGSEVSGIKVIGLIDGDVTKRVFTCPVCGRHFIADVSNVFTGAVWHCGCMRELIRNKKRQVIENRNIK